MDATFPGPELMLGPFLAGATMDFLLMGFLVAQFRFYFNTYQTDSRAMRGVVWIIVFLNIVKTIMCFVIIYRKFVVHFADYPAAVAQEFSDLIEPLTVAIIGVVVQGYFARRCWLLRNKNYILLGVLTITILVGLGGAISLTIEAADMPDAWGQAKFVTSVVTMLTGSFVTDVLISGITLLHFWNSRSGANTPTDTLMNRLTVIGWQCAVPPTICAIFNLAFYVGMAQSNAVYITFNILLAKLYSLSMMHTINSRDELRRGLYEEEQKWSGIIGFGITVPSAQTNTAPRSLTLGADAHSHSLADGDEKRRSFFSPSAFDVRTAQLPILTKTRSSDTANSSVRPPMIQTVQRLGPRIAAGFFRSGPALRDEEQGLGGQMAGFTLGGRPSEGDSGKVGTRSFGASSAAGTTSARTSMSLNRQSYIGSPPPFPPPTQPIPPLPAVTLPTAPAPFRTPFPGLPSSVRPGQNHHRLGGPGTQGSWDSKLAGGSISTIDSVSSTGRGTTGAYAQSPLSIVMPSLATTPFATSTVGHGTLPSSGEPQARFPGRSPRSAGLMSGASSVRTTRTGASGFSLDKDLPPLPTLDVQPEPGGRVKP